MLKLVGAEKSGIPQIELVLFDEADRPTPLLLGLILAELTIDCLVGYAAYRVFKGSSHNS